MYYKNIFKSSGLKLSRLGFSLIELLIVIGIIGVLAIVVLAIINPIDKLALARDSGRTSATAQLGHAVVSFYTIRGGEYPDPAMWPNEIVATGETGSFPVGIRYSSYGITNCDKNEQPSTIPTYCYDYDASNGAIVFVRMESWTHNRKCANIGEETYFVYSTADGHGGIICSLGDPSPWPAGSENYID